RPTPTSPWSVPSSSVTNSRVSVGAGRPTTSGLSAGGRRKGVGAWVVFMLGSVTRSRPGAPGAALCESAAAEEVLVAVIPAVIPPMTVPVGAGSVIHAANGGERGGGTHPALAATYTGGGGGATYTGAEGATTTGAGAATAGTPLNTPVPDRI